MSICITLNESLIRTLETHGIDPSNYSPAYAGESVGLDLYNVGPDVELPTLHPSHYRDPITEYEYLKRLIPTGVRIALPRNFVALLRERGSVIKTPLVLRAGVIDPGYTGEIFVNLVNVSQSGYTIKHGDKLPVQLVVVPARTDFQVITRDEYNTLTSDASRQAGKVGSSD